MISDRLPKPSLRFVSDMLVGFGVFCLATIAVLGPSAAAQIVQIQIVQIDGIFSQTPHSLSMAAANGFSQSTGMGVPLAVRDWSGTNNPQTIAMILAGAFSMLFALNLAFVRHLRQAHVPKTTHLAHAAQTEEARSKTLS